MWIIRFHLLQPKHYNKVNRICKKHGFVPRKTSCLVFAKAATLHITQKTSWRALGREFHIDHALLYRFYELSRESQMLEEILHTFLDAKVSLYIGDTKTIDIMTLDNSQEIYDLTKSAFTDMLSHI